VAVAFWTGVLALLLAALDMEATPAGRSREVLAVAGLFLVVAVAEPFVGVVVAVAFWTGLLALLLAVAFGRRAVILVVALVVVTLGDGPSKEVKPVVQLAELAVVVAAAMASWRSWQWLQLAAATGAAAELAVVVAAATAPWRWLWPAPPAAGPGAELGSPCELGAPRSPGRRQAEPGGGPPCASAPWPTPGGLGWSATARGRPCGCGCC